MSKMSLQTKVRETIRKYNMVSRGDRVLAAVSGGPDSVALLHLLSGLRGELGLHLEVAHLQHGIRGEDAKQDALFVARLAERLAFPFHVRDVDLPRMRLERGGGNLEAMGREERYRFFAALAAQRGIHRVATGHTRDDRVETLLMRLLRGSGRGGLSGMAPVRPLSSSRGRGHEEPLLVRPLIEASRREILDYLQGEGLEYRTDPTNMDLASLRNWVRLHLLPQLRERMDPHVDERLSQSADLLCEEEEIFAEMARDRLRQVVRGRDLMRGPLLQEGKALQRRLLRLWLEATLGDLGDVGFHHVESALEFIDRGPAQGRFPMPRGWSLVKAYEAVCLEKKRQKQKALCYSYGLPQQGELVIPEAGMKMQSSCGSFSSHLWPQDNLEALFDSALLPETLTVRNFRAGDRFQPLGMQGHKKVKDLFIEKKVPLAVRATLPLLLAGGEILWIPRYGRSKVAKIGPQTKEVVKVRLVAYNG